MGNNPPWLDSLSDDWVPLPGTPTSPVPARSLSHSRQSSRASLASLQDSPSRIPVPARRPAQSPIDSKKKVTRPCHFYKREPPTPKTPRTPKTPSKLKSPAPDKTKRTPRSAPTPAKPSPAKPKPKPSPASGRKPSTKQQKQPAMETRSPLRSVSNMSSQSGQQSTVQIRPKKGKEKESTPEWRKRLVRGDIPAGEQRDLFGPIGLESVFKPPTPGSQPSQHETIPTMKQANEFWEFDGHSLEQEMSGIKDPAESSGHTQEETEDHGPPDAKPEIENKEKADSSPAQSPKGTLNIKKGPGNSMLDPNRYHDESQNDTNLRSASGLEDLRNEGITPITFSRTNTVDGNGTSEVIKSALKQVTSKLESLSSTSGDRPGSRASDSVLLHPPSDPHGETLPEDDDLLDVTSHSLPQDLSMGTVDYRGRGAFTNFRRGQYLSEGSFHKRMLTPGSFPSHRLTPATVGNLKIRSSPPFYHKTHPMVDPPAFPRPSSAHVGASTQGPGEARSPAAPSSGSPLKLFGDHDTFTNNRLLRRMSQFEETFGDLSEEDEPVSPSEEARRKGENRSYLNVRHDGFGEYSSRRSERPRSRNSATPRINRFGDGHLDHFDFSDTSPYEPKLLNKDISDQNLRPSSRRRSSLGRRQHRRSSYLDHRESRMSRRPESAHNDESPSRASARRDQSRAQNDDPNHTELNGNSNTTAKDPIPKRRRTILNSDSSDQDDWDIDDLPAQPTQNISLLQRNLMQHGTKYEDDQRLAQSQSHSGRRPRTPTPNQSRPPATKRPLSQRAQSRLDSNDRIDEKSPPPMEVPKVKVTGANEETRKGSITTQDFLNEATKIMNIIRANGRTNGGLSSVEESEMEHEQENESYEEESTREEFSRPPSRDGVDMRKLREPQEPNEDVLSHLKKFQENDEVDFGVNASTMSLNLDSTKHTMSNVHSDDETQSLDLGFEDDGVESSPKNIRIHGNPRDPRKDANEDGDPQDLFTMNTQVSAKSFSARSIPTGSSQSSHAKGVLSSDLVSHLIPEQVNGFTYDRFKHLWVKGRAEKSPEKPKADESEDDPFQDIPDLSVDELQEMMRTQALGSPEKQNSSNLSENRDVTSPLSKRSAPSRDSRPQTREGEPSINASSLQSKVTRSSIPNSGTRATSWGTDDGKHRESSSEVEHEIQLHEGRLSKPPRGQRDPNHQARVVTISFSSPLVSHVAYSDDTSPTKVRGNKLTDSDHAPPTEAETSSDRPQPSRSSLLPPRQTSLDGKPFVRRPISRIDESNEDTAEDQSLIRRERAGPVQATPVKGGPENSLVLRSAGPDTSYSFHLSPLPDFTVDQIDQSLQLELSYVAQRTQPTSLRQVHGTFALAAEELVKHITEVEPFEPYWEHVRRLILRNKGLITLHKLSDFCPRLEDLDVSDNYIGQLSGIPSSLRTLKIQRNCLSSLTAWGHLTNLQYLDVSGNELESLDGFGSLIHLRELKANNNNIRNIDGIFDMNGLLSLKLSNNLLTDIDFEEAELSRLTELDLSHNQLKYVRNINSLSSLSTLNLGFNQISKIKTSGSLRSLSSLKLSNNRFDAFDVKMFPSLTLLYLDQNFLSTVSGLENCHGLEVFSAREQLATASSSDRFFNVDLGLLKDVRKVFLSSNGLSPQILSPSSPLLSLQLLDVASCNFESLPVDFSLNFPNVKVLNLNFNSLTNVEELVGMNCLSRLTIAGNRLSRMRRLCQVLSRIGRTSKGDACSLQKLDLRGNPLTVRFYPPPVTGSGKDADKRKLKSREEEREKQSRAELDLPAALADIGRCQDVSHPATWGEEDDEMNTEKDVEINDPYTLPLADAQADQKYLSNLDESTRLRRRVLELMLYAGTSGSIRTLDGLELRPALEEGSDMDHAWTKLEKLGVLRRKAITG